ncbi:class I SAM-dependent methyltransferase [Henriciella sp.]|uniref:class I SAM-dependent methyltransferase n=1 Tax=Henriciella sp. TaxID=1968823 RepID=UPI001837011A|nr:class I SAM-dependent methyltransferase [Henriciella sp.]HIG21937.1 class I SAM-dependent methyltransferase [Henriciella sp.]
MSRTAALKYIKTPASMRKNAGKEKRMLDIGPGATRISGFETLNVTFGKNVDYLADASTRIPFPDRTFVLVHASHVLEHIPWYHLEDTVSEWVRVLEKGGKLEIWVPNGYKLAKFLVDIENNVEREEWKDGWRPRSMGEDPYQWLNGRLLYGVRSDYPSWHQAILTPKSLMKLMEKAGLHELQIMDESEVRSVPHGWINLGIRGTKI